MGGAAEGVAERLRRDVFERGVTLPLAWRFRQLRGLHRMLVEAEHHLTAALFSDLGKSPHECFFSEIVYMKHSCDYAIRNLKHWVKSHKMCTPLVTFPTRAYVVPEPLGVVLIIAPWNFPITLALDPLIGAIAAGNAAVLKPSEVAPATSAALAKLIPTYLDPSAVCVVEGGVEECTALLDQKWDKIFFTGSAPVGKIVMAAATKHLTPVTLELGGKCPLLVEATADLDVTARRLVFAKWNSTYGQACVAPDYVLVEASVSQKLMEKVRSTLVDFYGEDPKLSGDHSRVVNSKHLDRLKGFLTDETVSKTIFLGGEIDEANLYMAPTILLNPPEESRVMKEEIFGPILPVMEVKHINDAVKFVKARPKPLAVYVFTSNKDCMNEAETIQTGSVVFNDAVVQFVLDGLPFGGIGESGMGSYHGKYSFDTFSHPKALLYRTRWLDLHVRYPPFSTARIMIARRLMEFDYFGAMLALLGIKRER